MLIGTCGWHQSRTRTASRPQGKARARGQSKGKWVGRKARAGWVGESQGRRGKARQTVGKQARGRADGKGWQGARVSEGCEEKGAKQLLAAAAKPYGQALHMRLCCKQLPYSLH